MFTCVSLEKFPGISKLKVGNGQLKCNLKIPVYTWFDKYVTFNAGGYKMNVIKLDCH